MRAATIKLVMPLTPTHALPSLIPPTSTSKPDYSCSRVGKLPTACRTRARPRRRLKMYLPKPTSLLPSQDRQTLNGVLPLLRILPTVLFLHRWALPATGIGPPLLAYVTRRRLPSIFSMSSVSLLGLLLRMQLRIPLVLVTNQ